MRNTKGIKIVDDNNFRNILDDHTDIKVKIEVNDDWKKNYLHHLIPDFSTYINRVFTMG